MMSPEAEEVLRYSLYGGTHRQPGDLTYLKYEIRETPEPQNWGDEEP